MFMMQIYYTLTKHYIFSEKYSQNDFLVDNWVRLVYFWFCGNSDSILHLDAFSIVVVFMPMNLVCIVFCFLQLH